MSAQSESRFIPIYRQIVTHLSTPVYRNGYFLLVSSFATSGIGLIYWIIAAHKYPAYMVGINSAIIAAMTLIAGISELNLMSALIRFIPMAGRSTKRFVVFTYLASLGVAAIISFIFIKNLGYWSPALKFLGDNRTLSIWFILSTMAWCIFVLQDSVLTGLRQTSWVPVENTVFSLTKIVLLIIFAVSIPSFGIYASWTFALIVAILPTNYYIFRKLIPTHENREEQAKLSIEPKQIVRFASADYLGAIFWMMTNTLMPVIVTSVSGAEANAYFYLAWTIANSLYLVGPALGASMIVETAKDPHKLRYYSHRVFSNTMRIVVPAAVLVSAGAPYILLVFGKGYSAEGATLLRLLALSSIPSVFNTVFASTARVQRRMKAVVLTLGSLSSMVLVSSYILLRLDGIVGIGFGWLASQTLVAAIIYLTQLRKLWKNLDKFPSRQQIVKSGQKAYWRMVEIFYKIAGSARILPLLAYLHQKWIFTSKRSRISSILPGITSQLSRELGNSTVNGLKLQKVVDNHTDTIIFFLGGSDGQTPVVVKISPSWKEAASLKKQDENLAMLKRIDELGDWRGLLPKIITSGEVKGRAYFVEYAMPGTSLANILFGQNMNWDLVSRAAEKINVLHRSTSHSIYVNKQIIRAWVDEPFENLIFQFFDGNIPAQYQTAISNIRNKLYADLIDRELYVSWIHGDYSPANILVNPSGYNVTGIVDWDLARTNELPQLDLMHLLISIRMERTQSELGHVVSSLLKNQDWEPAEINLLRSASQGMYESFVTPHDLLLLTWLRHINANLSKTSRFDHQGRWVQENFSTVLQLFSGN